MKLRHIRRRTNSLTEVKRWGFHWYWTERAHHSRRRLDPSLGVDEHEAPMRKCICTWNVRSAWPSINNLRRRRNVGAP